MLRMALVTLVLVGFLVPSSLSQYKIVRHNPFASLTPTLAEYTVDGEDGEVLNLACPGETRIVITAASYQPASNFSHCHLSSPLLQVTCFSLSAPSLSRLTSFCFPGSGVLPATALLLLGSLTCLPGLLLLHPRPLPLPQEGGQGVLPLQTSSLQIRGHLPLQPRPPPIPLLPGGDAENQLEVLSHLRILDLKI